MKKKMLEVKPEILAKAKSITSARESKENYLSECLSAGICPSCGEKIKYVRGRRKHKGFFAALIRATESGYICDGHCFWNNLTTDISYKQIL